MDRRTWLSRGLVAVAALGLVAASCSSSSRGSSNNTSGGGSSTTAGSNGGGSSTKFGDLASPCGAGNASGATDQGVTNTDITIEYGDDRGFSASPGLNKEIGDAVKGMIQWCNNQGGILGRKINGVFGDAAYSQANTRVQEACKTAFMLVGEGWAADETAEQTRLGCNLVAVPTYSVGPDFANSVEMYQAVPNPDDYLPASSVYQAAKLWPDKIAHADILHTNLESATESSSIKVRAAGEAAGFHWLDCGVKLNYFGEADYKPFVQKFINCGAQILFWNISPGPELYGMLQAMDQLNYHPIILGEANIYTAQMAAWNTQGFGNNIYVREAFQPLENADIVPAVKDYLDAVHAVNGAVSQLGEQAASSFLLWATEAKACGSNLTRQCMVNNLAKVHQWTGGGLNATGDTGANQPPKCGLLLKLTNTSWSQFYPQTRGQIDCNDQYLFKVPEADWGTTLNSDRLANKYLPTNYIKPQS